MWMIENGGYKGRLFSVIRNANSKLMNTCLCVYQHIKQRMRHTGHTLTFRLTY
jgi:hypothetical protein